MKGVIILLPLLCGALSSPLGGWEDENSNDEEAQAIARSCVQTLDQSSNSLYHIKFLGLKSVKFQIVAGKKYNLTIDVGETGCQKHRLDEDLTGCSVNQVKECNVIVWVTPFLKDQPPNIESFTCEVKQMKRGLEEAGQSDDELGSYSNFLDFKAKYNKQYSAAEQMMRFKIFRQNMNRVKELRANEIGTAKYGATEFADMTEEEFTKTHLTPRWTVKLDPLAQIADIPDVTPPSAWDWRDHNAVSEVKNQGSCGSCWAFSTTGNVEGQWAIKKGQLVSLSEQELVDCDKLDDGCNGGLPINAYKEIERLGGLETEKEYPYKGEDEKCAFVKSEAKVDISGFLNISSNEEDMAAWLYKNGPISIGINAMAMQFYFGGVSHPWKIFCNPDDLDHGVLIVGYGVDKGYFSDTPYWIIKNSWGSSWGESGYYRVYRGDGVCGLNKMPTSAVVN